MSGGGIPTLERAPSTALLVRAAAHPDPVMAREAWDTLVTSEGGVDRVMAAIGRGGQQRLMPLLGSRAAELDLPPEVRAGCADASTRAWGLNERLLAAASPVVAALGEAGVPVAALKGTALLGDVYPEHALRPLGDMDLWVPHRSVPAALAVAEQLGWSVRGGPLQAGRGPFLQVLTHAATLSGPTRGPTVDLHWRPIKAAPMHSRPPRWPGELLAPLPRTHPLAGTGLVRPRPELLLVQLAAHGARPDNTGIVHWIVDVHRLLAVVPGFDVELMVRTARELDVTLHVVAGLASVVELLDDLPGGPISTLQELLLATTSRRTRDEVRRWRAEQRADVLRDASTRASRSSRLWAMVRSQATLRDPLALLVMVVAGTLTALGQRLRRRGSTSIARPKRR